MKTSYCNDLEDVLVSGDAEMRCDGGLCTEQYLPFSCHDHDQNGLCCTAREQGW